MGVSCDNAIHVMLNYYKLKSSVMFEWGRHDKDGEAFSLNVVISRVSMLYNAKS